MEGGDSSHVVRRLRGAFHEDSKGVNLSLRSILSSFTLSLLLTSASAWPQEPPAPEKKLGWMDKAELALLFAAGNSETSTFGFRNRLSRVWSDAELHIEVAGLRRDYGISVTHQVPTIGDEVTFAGLTLSADLMRKLTGSTTSTHLTIAEENLDETDDLRLDSLTSVAVAMTGRLALQVSLKFLFDNVPSFVEADLISPLTGLPVGILVPVQADKLDTLFNVALVVNF